MDRKQIFPGQIPLETDMLGTNKNVMIALGKLSAAVFGTSNCVNGLSVGPNSPAALNVIVQPGEVYSLQNIDGTAYSSIAADTTHQIVKQGILLDSTTLSTPAPSTAGFSINYLIQAAFSEVDTDAVVLPYYNAANPTQAYSGPANAGTTNNTTRKDTITLSAKAGIAATTGTQTTPAADAGYIGLYVVTVANGQTTVTSPNIAQATAAPIIPAGVIPAIQSGVYGYAADTGTANVYQTTYSPAITALTDGMVLKFKAKTANTGASTFSPNGLTAQPIWGGDHAALTGGEIAANGDVWAQWNTSLNGTGAWVLIDSTGGSLPVAPGIASNHAANLGQMWALVGDAGSVADPNVIDNSNFAVNQRAVSGTVTLAAGAYGHDRWKAGAGGCTYTFATSGPDTIITVTAGSLMQICEASAVEGGTYRLSQSGTAQARVAINGAATSGAYAASPLTTASATGGQTITVEFSTGTIDKVQLQRGTQVSAYARRKINDEIAACQRHAWATAMTGSAGAWDSTTGVMLSIRVPVTMRATPTASRIGTGPAKARLFVSSGSDLTSASPTITIGYGDANGMVIIVGGFSGATQNAPSIGANLSSDAPYVLFSADL